MVKKQQVFVFRRAKYTEDSKSTRRRQEQAMERLKENSSNWKFVLLVNLLILPAYTCVVTDVVLLCFVLLGNEQSRG
ncbi:hypothetical protein Tco_0543053 [Tanacetum coccineum]